MITVNFAFIQLFSLIFIFSSYYCKKKFGYNIDILMQFSTFDFSFNEVIKYYIFLLDNDAKIYLLLYYIIINKNCVIFRILEKIYK